MYTSHQARLESLIASAHRAVWRVAVHAEGMDRDELAHDLRLIENSLCELGKAEISRRPGLRALHGGARGADLRAAD